MLTFTEFGLDFSHKVMIKVGVYFEQEVKSNI